MDRKLAGKGMAMDTDSLIPTSWFYMEENEKNKLNWFLYEYACTLFVYIKNSRKKVLRKWKSGLNDEQLAVFCAYFSKRMRQSVFRRLAGDTEEAVAMDDYLCDYFHTNTYAENDAIMDIAGGAWNSLMDTCIACPTRCLSERFMRCELFDRMERGGYYS